jgi:hypothetical protein
MYYDKINPLGQVANLNKKSLRQTRYGSLKK